MKLGASSGGRARRRWPAAVLLGALVVVAGGSAVAMRERVAVQAVATSPSTTAPAATSPLTPTVTAIAMTATTAISAGAGWPIRAVDTMKLSRDTLRKQLSTAQIAAVVRLDAGLHVSHVTVDVYYDAPAYMVRWVQAIRTTRLHVWFRAHWYAWESHHGAAGLMTPAQYIAQTRYFLQQHARTLLRNGDIFDFCPEPENGAYWEQTYGAGWTWRSSAAKHAFNTFIRSGVYMARSTLDHRNLRGVTVTAIGVNPAIALHTLSKPTLHKLGLITLDLYPEGKTRDPATAARLLVAQIAAVYRRWPIPILIGEHGYSRDVPVDDTTQARVLAAELRALRAIPYLRGLNYWVDAGGPGFGGYTNLYRTASRDTWLPRAAARVLASAYATATASSHT